MLSVKLPLADYSSLFLRSSSTSLLQLLEPFLLHNCSNHGGMETVLEREPPYSCQGLDTSSMKTNDPFLVTNSYDST